MPAILQVAPPSPHGSPPVPTCSQSPLLTSTTGRSIACAVPRRPRLSRPVMRGLATGGGKKEGSPAAIRSGFHIDPMSRACARSQVRAGRPGIRGLTGRGPTRGVMGLDTHMIAGSRACSTPHTLPERWPRLGGHAALPPPPTTVGGCNGRWSGAFLPSMSVRVGHRNRRPRRFLLTVHRRDPMGGRRAGWADEHGQVAIVVALMLVVLLGFAALWSMSG
jgi:hypothetical protein